MQTFIYDDNHYFIKIKKLLYFDIAFCKITWVTTGILLYDLTAQVARLFTILHSFDQLNTFVGTFVKNICSGTSKAVFSLYGQYVFRVRLFARLHLSSILVNSARDFLNSVLYASRVNLYVLSFQAMSQHVSLTWEVSLG